MEIIIKLVKATIYIALIFFILGFIAGDITWSHYQDWWLFVTVGGRVVALLLGFMIINAITDIFDIGDF